MTRVQLDEAAALIGAGELVAFPTETVYGLGANALDPNAVAKVFEAKERPRFDPLIVHVGGLNMAEALIAEGARTEKVEALTERFWPGPLTLILPKSEAVPDIVTAGRADVGLRSPDHPVAAALIERSQRPIAAPSANRFGALSPTTAEAVADQLGEALAVLDGGQCRVGIESTVLSLSGLQPLLLRPGAVAREELEDVVGPILVPTKHELTTASPGRAERHYAPRTRMRWRTPHDAPRAEWGLLTFGSGSDGHGWGAFRDLSPAGRASEAAHRLFQLLRELDASGIELVLVDPVPEDGLWVAIRDRMQRGMVAP